MIIGNTTEYRVAVLVGYRHNIIFPYLLSNYGKNTYLINSLRYERPDGYVKCKITDINVKNNNVRYKTNLSCFDNSRYDLFSDDNWFLGHDLYRMRPSDYQCIKCQHYCFQDRTLCYYLSGN